MARDIVNLPRQAAKSIQEVKEQTYWGAVGAKLARDKITMAAIILLIFMITISLAAPWLAHRVLGFDPTDTNLRNRNAPPLGQRRPGPNSNSFPAFARLMAWPTAPGQSGEKSCLTRRRASENV
jgi:hypothetical protein